MQNDSYYYESRVTEFLCSSSVIVQKLGASCFFEVNMVRLFTIIPFLIFQAIDCIPLMRMRLCIASTDPLRLQSQCVLCHNRRFILTVRQCTGGSYLPANVSVDEGYCMIKQCRQQIPLIPPQPYGTTPSQAPSSEMSGDLLYAGSGEHEYQYQYHTVKPMRIRPPAIIHIGKPVRPGLLSGRPIIFGKRSVRTENKTLPPTFIEATPDQIITVNTHILE